MAETQEQQPHTNGLDGADEDERSKIRPADIDADMREMERRKRVELIMNSRLFREELERIIETQMKDGGAGTGGLLQQLQDMMGIPKQANAFKSSNCVIPINDIRGVESMGYAKGEKLLRCKLAAVYRLMDLHGWAQGVGNQVTARLNQDQEHFIVNPYGMLCHEITASSLVKIDMQGNVVEQGTTNFGVNVAAFSLHAAIHAARPDVKCAIHVHTPAVLAVSALKCGLLPVSQESVVVGEVSSHPYAGGLAEPEEREKVARNLGPINKVLLLANHGAVCCGETVEEAFFNVYNTIVACETQLKLMPIGVDNLALVSEETRKQMYEAARRAPDGTTASGAPRPMAAEPGSVLADKLAERKWRVGGVEFEALMRMLDNAGFRTGYIYRHPLIKGDPPRPRNDVEVPPAVSSLGYLLEEEEMYKQGIWKIGRKGNDRTRWLNSPNVYQKVEILETGTPDPKKITKWVDANADEWVADGSPTHSSTPVKIDAALQFVPKNTNPKEFKLLQQQIKDNRRADKISAGPQSHILEGVSWEEAKKMQDAGVTQTGDQVVVVGAASKGIIQRGYQHNAMVYKAPYAKNPFDSVTDEELDEYKKVIEKKAKGEYDTDFSESESAQISKRVDHLRSPTSADETEEESRDEPRVLRIETKQAPKPSQPEVVLSDDDEHENVNVQLLNAERVQATQQVLTSIIQTSHNRGRLLSPTLVLRVPNYRTNRHNGMPQGSYMIPNPIHYHVCRYKYTEQLRKPLYVTYNEQKQHLQNKRLHLEDAKFTINITNVHRPLTIDIPIDIVKQFIQPFYNIINYNNISSSSNEQTIISQNNHTFTLERFIHANCNEEVKSSNESDINSIISSNETITHEEEEEIKIMRKQRENLMTDIDNNISLLDLDTSFSDVEVILEDETISNKIQDFARKIDHCQFSAIAPRNIQIWDNNNNNDDDDKIETNNNNIIIVESLNSLDTITTTGSYSSSTSNVSEYKTAERIPSPEKSSLIIDEARTGPTDNFTTNDTILKSILEISKSYEDALGLTLTQSQNDDSFLNDHGKYIWPDHNCATAVKLISKKIYKYLTTSCIETIEHLEFPEVRCYHDAEQLFDEIISIFDRFADCFPSDGDIYQLKNSIMVNISKNIERHFLIIPLTDKNEIDKIIEEQKFTTLKKFIALLVYILFDKIENPEFQCTHYDLPDLADFDYPEMNSIKFHSTPETDEVFHHLSDTSDANNTINEEPQQLVNKKKESESITTFLTQKSEKTGSLQYWFMINDKVINPKRSSSLFFNNKPVNISPQRLRRSSAPARFISDAPKLLSPIPEEPRRNIFADFNKPTATDDAEPKQLSTSPDEQPKTSSSSTASHATATNKNYYEICYNFNVSDDYETYSVKTSNTTKKSPVKRQNGRILFMKEVTFIPKENVNARCNAPSTTTIVNSVTFIPKTNSKTTTTSDDLTSNSYVSGNSYQFDNDDDDDNDTTTTDWMGYESAKF